jgi:hypothetical protein
VRGPVGGNRFFHFTRQAAGPAVRIAEVPIKKTALSLLGCAAFFRCRSYNQILHPTSIRLNIFSDKSKKKIQKYKKNPRLRDRLTDPADLRN